MYADVMTYQSLLRMKNKIRSRYIFVVCDEAHFFTSDAMFNPHTQKILQSVVMLFQDAIRVYMSATPYECLKYIIEHEGQYQNNVLNWNKAQGEYESGIMVFYHFKRDYSYLDVKYYSLIDELYGKVIESVSQRKEKWLIFIDNKEKGAEVKKELEKLSIDMGCSLGEKNDKSNGIEKIFAVDADSKKDPIYQEIVYEEELNKDTYVLISTSVLDNGVNLKGIDNIVVSDMDKVKCLQMAGRARVKGADDHKTLYIKRFDAGYVKKRIDSFETQRDAYHKYECASCEEKLLDFPNTYYFLEKYYNGSEKDWKDAKHWFGRPIDKPTGLYLNKIAKALLDVRLPQYQAVLDEMLEESSQESDKQQDPKGINHIGQKYLEHQLSWFGKKYCIDDDITFMDKEKSKKDFVAFIEKYAERGEQIGKGSQEEFKEIFTELSDKAFGRKDRNKDRKYSITKMNSILEEENMNYKVNSKSSYWVVEEFDWKTVESE